MSNPLADALSSLSRISGHEGWDDITATVADPVWPNVFRADEAAAAALAAGAAEAAAIWEQRTGEAQEIRVNTRTAGASLLSTLMQRFEDSVREPVYVPPTTAANDFFRTRDGRWVLLHASFDNGRAPLSVLGCADDRDAISAAVAEWDALDLENAMAAAGACSAMVRSPDEWDASDQGRRLAATPLVQIDRVGDATPVPFASDAAAPLSGVRVLDLTRVLAGPASARTLAGFGAEVLNIAGPGLPSVPSFVADTGHGKRSALVDLTTAEGRDRVLELVADADVFVQGYRGGAMERLGLSEEKLAEVNPALVHVAVSCYGHDGPWRTRPGWEQLAQTVSGMAAVHGGDGGPRLIPVAVNDYTTGYLAAFGALVALRRRSSEGGGWRVKVSLTRTAMWTRSLGMDSARPSTARPFSDEEFARSSIREDSGFGPMTFLGPGVELSSTPPAWTLPSVPLGTHNAGWTD